MERREWLVMGGLFVVLFAVRLFLSAGEFTPDAYFHIRMVEHIAQTGVPMTYDPLSYGGRVLQFSPLFHYLLAVFSWVIPLDIVVHVLPQLFVSLLSLLIYIIVKKITENTSASSFSAVLAAVIPAFFAETLFSVSPLTLALPLVFLTLYFFLYIEKNLYDLHFILVIIALSLVHPSSIVLVIALIGYLLITKLEKLELEKSELELILFSTFLFLWIQFIIYKKSFLTMGFARLVQQNIPAALAAEVFSLSSGAFLQIGILPLIGGILCMYKYLLRMKNKALYMYIALSIGVALLVFFKLLPPAHGFMYLGISLSILSGPAYVFIIRYLNKTRVSRYTNLFVTFLFILVIPMMILPSIMLVRSTPVLSQDMDDALRWIAVHTSDDSVVLAPIELGYAVEALAQRRTVADTNFLLIENADVVLADITRIYKTPLPTEAVKLFTTYAVDYIVIIPGNEPSYLNEPCLREVYKNNAARIYHSACRLSVT